MDRKQIMTNVDRLCEIEALRVQLHDETIKLVRETSRHLNKVGKGVICCLSFMPDTKMGRDKRKMARKYFDDEYSKPITALPGMKPTSPKLPGMKPTSPKLPGM